MNFRCCNVASSNHHASACLASDPSKPSPHFLAKTLSVLSIELVKGASFKPCSALPRPAPPPPLPYPTASCPHCRLAKAPVQELVRSLLKCCADSTKRAGDNSAADRAAGYQRNVSSFPHDIFKPRGLCLERGCLELLVKLRVAATLLHLERTVKRQASCRSSLYLAGFSSHIFLEGVV